jgi:formylglycine-generating enzyme
MGSDEGDDDERPTHWVHLDEYDIAAHPVTNDEYAQFVRATGHRPPGLVELPSIVGSPHLAFADIAASQAWVNGQPPPGRGNHPVTLVTFQDALAYCRWLTVLHGAAVRLPTEAEWEKAARGGLEGKRYPWGDEIDVSRANFLPHAELKPKRGTQPIGSYPGNGYGLSDMAGNVWQWVADWYAGDTYTSGEIQNPLGPLTGSLRLVRGGAWVNDDVNYLRCASRHAVPVDTYCYSIGFRIASLGR